MQTPTSTITTTGDLGGHKIAMGFDETALSHIMGILTDMYSDAELACIREYSTNALDAHIEAGNTAPIEVFTPNALSPYLRIKDYGVGLSKSDIENMYSKYGASTKRGTNDQVGMLGIGAKSALSLVPQFSITSVKDGLRIVVSVSRNAEGAGQMEILAETPTTEPNGVEISIPVPRSHSFASKCQNFFRFWKQGTVLVDGKEPQFITGRPVGNKFIINSELGKDYIVMGNVAYPVKEGLYEHGYSYRQLGIVAFVNIGDVNFTPSREELQYTKKTESTIQALRKQFSAGLIVAAQQDVADAPTHVEAWKRAREWRTSFYNRLGEFKYKGVQVPSDITFGTHIKDGYTDHINGKTYNITGRSSKYANWMRSVSPGNYEQYMFVTGFAESLKMSPTQREKCAIYATNKGWSVNQVVIFTQDEIFTDKALLPFVKDVKVVKWEEVAKIKITRAKGAGVKRTEPYDLYVGSWTYKQVSTLDTSLPIIYVSPAEHRQPDFLSAIFTNAQIVMLGMNRWDKFKRDYPTAVHYEAAIVKAKKGLVDQFTRTDKILWNHSGHWDRKAFDLLKNFDILDPEVVEWIKVLTDKGVELSQAAKSLRAFPRGYNSADIEDVKNPLTKYPLVGSMDLHNREHTVWYMNTYYTTTLKEN